MFLSGGDASFYSFTKAISSQVDKLTDLGNYRSKTGPWHASERPAQTRLAGRAPLAISTDFIVDTLDCLLVDWYGSCLVFGG